MTLPNPNPTASFTSMPNPNPDPKVHDGHIDFHVEIVKFIGRACSVNPLLLDKSTVRDTVSGIQFNHNDWVEIDADIWERLKDAKYKQGKSKVSVLICNDEEPDDSPVEDDKDSTEEVVEDFFIAEEE